MARHESQYMFYPPETPIDRVVIPDAGTSVTVEYYNGAEWVEDSLSPITTPDTIYCCKARVRLTPDVGGFFVDEGLPV